MKRLLPHPLLPVLTLLLGSIVLAESLRSLIAAALPVPLIVCAALVIVFLFILLFIASVRSISATKPHRNTHHEP